MVARGNHLLYLALGIALFEAEFPRWGKQWQSEGVAEVTNIPRVLRKDGICYAGCVVLLLF